jgi:hypothetical protein
MPLQQRLAFCSLDSGVDRVPREVVNRSGLKTYPELLTGEFPKSGRRSIDVAEVGEQSGSQIVVSALIGKL